MALTFEGFATAAASAAVPGVFTIDTEFTAWGVRISTTIAPAGTASAVGPLDADAPWWISDRPRPDTAWAEHRALVRGFQQADVPPVADRQRTAIAIAEAASTHGVHWQPPEWRPPVPTVRASPLPADVRERLFHPHVVRR